jgi:hypothetical protein
VAAHEQFVARVEAVEPAGREYVGRVRLLTRFVHGLLATDPRERALMASYIGSQ